MERICKDCSYYNNGWCNKRKTNKDLKNLTECEFKKSDKATKLKNYLEQKKFELQIEENSYNRGIVKGLEIALKILGE